ncbi:MAG: MATE family efflux transporter [Bacteroidales bacterium]
MILPGIRHFFCFKRGFLMRDLSVGSERRLIFNFTLPMLLGNVFQQLYNIVDSIIIGNYLGKEALAAVGASFPVIFTLISFVIGITTGANIIIAQFFGAKQNEKVKASIDTLFIFLFVASIVISTLGIVFSESIFELMSLPAEVIPSAKSYFVIYSIGYIFFFGFNGTSAILRGLGDSKTPLYFLIFATLANIVLDYLFLIVFNWGIEGVAWATLLAQAGAFFSLIIYLNKYQKKGFVRLNPMKLQFDKQLFYQSVKIGLPNGIQNTLVALGMFALFSIVNAFGTATSAAYSIAMRIDSFASLPAMNFAAALATFTGQNLGANKPDRLRKGMNFTLQISSFVSIFVSSIAWLFSKELISLFTNDPEVIRIGSEYLLYVCSFYIVFSTMFVLNGVIRGAGETLVPMFITLLAMWFVRIPAAYLLSGLWGTIGLWLSIPTGWLVGLILSFVYYKTNRWKSKVVIDFSERNVMENSLKEARISLD